MSDRPLSYEAMIEPPRKTSFDAVIADTTVSLAAVWVLAFVFLLTGAIGPF